MFEVTRLQKISEQEQKEIADLVVQVMTEDGFTFDPKLYKDLKQLQKTYCEKGGTIKVIRDTDKIIGCVMVKRISSKEAQIMRLRLLSGYRGQGLGKLLLTRALEFCKENNFKKITTHSSDKNTKALNLFRSSGFMEIKRNGENLILELDFK